MPKNQEFDVQFCAKIHIRNIWIFWFEWKHFWCENWKFNFFTVFPDFFIRLFVVLISLLSIVPQYRISCIFFRQSNALIVWTFSDSWTSVLPQIQNCCSSFWVILSLWLSLGSFGCHLWLIPKFRFHDFKTVWISRNRGEYTCTHVQKKPNVQQDWKCLSKNAITKSKIWKEKYYARCLKITANVSFGFFRQFLS